MIDRITTVTSIIENLELSVGKDLPKEKLEQVKQFIHLYFQDVSIDDMESLQTVDLRGAALAHWELLQQRTPGTPAIRVYNPNLEQHGWQSSHSIIEIATDDMPMLVNSITIALKHRELDIHLVIHPILQCKRDEIGHLLNIRKDAIETDGYLTESVMQFQFDRLSDTYQLKSIQQEVETILANARDVFTDRTSMHFKMLETAKGIVKTPGDDNTLNEAAELLSWLSKHRFVYLGYVEFDLVIKNAETVLEVISDSRLGLFRQDDSKRDYELEELIPCKTPSYINTQEILSLTKANVHSPLHRSDYMDLITLPRYDKDDRIIGKKCFLGLYTSALYNSSGSDIPWIKAKIQSIIEKAKLTQQSHASRALQNILESYPRDSLFQTSEAHILDTALGILQIQDREKTRLFGSLDKYMRFCDCLAYVPRELYRQEIRIKIQEILLDQLNGSSMEFNIAFSSESSLARIHYIVQLKESQNTEPDWRNIEKLVINATRSWNDDFKEALIHHFSEEHAHNLYKSYHAGIPGNYKEDYLPGNACADIEHLENLTDKSDLDISFYRPLITSSFQVKSKIYVQENYIPLSDVIPVIENMGLKVDHERPYKVLTKDGIVFWIHEFTSHHADDLEIDPEISGENFKKAFLKIWKKEIENDGLNRLVIDANLNWRQTIILRSYSKYLLQIRAPFSLAYMIETLVENAGITERIVALFEARFNPDQKDTSEITSARIMEQLENKLKNVISLDEDRILRAYINLIQATVRTNFYKTDQHGKPLSYLSLKLQPGQINDMPKPHPLFDIFVYSPRIEGVHLRGGKVARGGLRWSDRREDFRTEVLGLMKAQTVKNSVIVPVGSKGGFFVKTPPEGASREELMEEVIYCYKTFLRGLLDLTDNLKNSAVLPPDQVVRYDEDDSYLVVAADKGTATFSDIANSVAAEYNFWLGDAFASGGSVGYDHKKMGITARGAWESVKRHFREKNHNTQEKEFSVIGIGDMAGDVFGNGMLLSEHIQLVGAFNHMHIFIDPSPNTEETYAERSRLFKLERSSWEDYSQKLLSEGGGIYSRKAKTIQLSEQAKKVLQIEDTQLTPDELIHHMLQAPVDLLWNGGIGTYVKSSQESHEDASDRANDVLRINGNQLRCKVVGEGGNLGLTQLARIEYIQHGGAMYTDAVDNSAGVDCSDHEVNIKILLDQIVQAGDMTIKQRNQLLARMTDEVGDLVLLDNYLQTQCISLVSVNAAQKLEDHARFISHLEAQGQLDRALEFLPNNEDIAERLANNHGLTLSELAVLVSYAKMTLFESVVESNVPDDPYLARRLLEYFPLQLSEKYASVIKQHRLSREIIATHLVNDLVNRLGPSFVYEMQDEFGADAAEVCKAFDITTNIFDMNNLWRDIEAQDNKVKNIAQQELQLLVRGLVKRTIHWLIRTRRLDLSAKEVVEYFKPSVLELVDCIPKCLTKANKKSYSSRSRHFTAAGFPADLSNHATKVVPLSSALDLVEICKSLNQPISHVASIYFELGSFLNLQWLRDQISELSARNHWHTLAKSGLRSDLHYQQRHLTAEVIRHSGAKKSAAQLVAKWASNNPGISQYSTLINELHACSSVDFTMLSLALNEVHKLLQSDRPLSQET